MPFAGGDTSLGGFQDIRHKSLGGHALSASFGVDYDGWEAVSLYAKAHGGTFSRKTNGVINTAPGPFFGQTGPFNGNERTTFVGAGAGLRIKGLPNPLGKLAGGAPFDRTAELQVGGGAGYGRTVVSGRNFRSTGSGVIVWGEAAYRMKVTNNVMIGPATTIIGGSYNKGAIAPTTTIIGSIRTTLNF
ncbi:MAG: hypothetical protein AB7O76_01560 [Rhizobiaceae bacterium]